MRQFALFDRRGRCLWTSHNPTTIDGIGKLAWEHCEGEHREEVKIAVGKALLGDKSVTIATEMIHGERHDYITEWHPLPLEEVGVVAIWRAKNSKVSLLTPNEIFIAFLLASGLSRKEVATKARLSTSTVDGHKQRIRAKLGLDSTSVLACGESGRFGTSRQERLATGGRVMDRL